MRIGRLIADTVREITGMLSKTGQIFHETEQINKQGKHNEERVEEHEFANANPKEP